MCCMLPLFVGTTILSSLPSVSLTCVLFVGVGVAHCDLGVSIVTMVVSTLIVGVY